MAFFNNTTCSFPSLRLRRNRSSSWIRKMVAENDLSASNIVLPLFIHEGNNKETEIKSLPGVKRLSIDLAVKQAKKASNLGISAIALFPVIDSEKKSTNAKEAYNSNNLICKTVKEIKKSVPEIGIICDVALDPYTKNGQDGITDNTGYVLNDETNAILCKQAESLAKAGADIVAPSDMMDGRIGEIRKHLDKKNFINVKIMSYAAKYASSFYGPFRDAVGSGKALAGADKRTYQMDPANSDEALREISLDLGEGADIIMIKPGMPYLDIVRRAKDNFKIPIAVYQVSGEYAMIKAASANGWIDEKDAMFEAMLAFKRAGANCIFTYAAIEIAENLQKG